MKNFPIRWLWAIMLIIPIFAQSQTAITGTITFQNQPLPGATIAVKDKQQATISDQFGKYTITAAPADVLAISFIGLKTSEVPVNSRAVIDVALEEDATSLKEVTINAGYYTVKDKERTGSIAKITSKDIEKQPVANVLATLQGRMAGVDVVQESGAPGGAFQIKIRGINSLRADGNNPLYIIDGVPFSSETIGYNQTSNTNPSLTNPLSSINPSDIESIEVLKDADATAIYGSRGANGVVLITTKKGRAGKTAFTVNASTAFGSITKKIDVMDTRQYLAMRQQAFANDGITVPDYAYDVNGTWSQTRNTDWQETLIGRTAEIDNFQASASGGSANTQYLLSGSYRTETTVMPGDFRYNTGSAHFSLNHVDEDRKFRATFSASYNIQKNDQPAADLTSVARTLAPNAPVLFNPDGSLNWENSTWANPLARLESKFLSRTNDLSANTVLSYDVTASWQAKVSLGYNSIYNDEYRTQPSTMYDPAYGLGSEASALNTNQTGRSSWIAEPQINWKKSFGKSKVEALVGGTFQSQRTTRLFQFGANFSSNALVTDLASASIRTVDLSDETIYKYQAFFARVNYNYDGRYIVNITGRRDGSSRFGPGRQFANFGALGAAWIFSKESFLSGSKVLSFGKLRASYGITGNDQIGDYQFLNTYIASGNNYQGVNALQPTRLYNPAFGWESSRKLEAAMELGFLHDRVFLTVSGYRNRSSDQLVGIPLPATTGFGSLTANLGATVENSGFEVTLRTENIKSDNFSWTTNFNLSANRNRLVAFPGLATSPYAGTYAIGESLNIFKLFHFTGIDPATGMYRFADTNGDGSITYDGDRTAIADLTPKYFGGIRNEIAYKGFSLDFLFQFVKQQNFAFTPGVPGTAVNQPVSAANAWQAVGDNAAYQPYTSGTNGDTINNYYRFTSSDGAIEDASYIRLKNIALSYDLPLQGIKGVRFRLYIQGQNLLTFTNYKNGDPEIPYSNYLPPLKVFSMGAQINF